MQIVNTSPEVKAIRVTIQDLRRDLALKAFRATPNTRHAIVVELSKEIEQQRLQIPSNRPEVPTTVMVHNEALSLVKVLDDGTRIYNTTDVPIDISADKFKRQDIYQEFRHLYEPNENFITEDDLLREVGAKAINVDHA